MKLQKITHFSPTQLLMPDSNWLFNYGVLNKEKRRSMKVGWNAAFGTAVHTGIQDMLTLGVGLDEAIDSAYLSYDFHEPSAGEPEEKQAAYRDDIPVCIENGVDLLAGLFGGAKEEQLVEVSLPGVDTPVIGYIDLCSSDAFAEVKTKARRVGAVKKDGTRGMTKASLPKEPEFNHLCQVALYHEATKLKPHLAYVAAHDAVLFTPDNCEQLQPERLQYFLARLRATAIRREALLQISDDARVLAGLIDPQFEHPFYWNHEFAQEAKELWKI